MIEGSNHDAAINLFDYNKNGKIDEGEEADALKLNENLRKEQKEADKFFDFDGNGKVDTDIEKEAYFLHQFNTLKQFMKKNYPEVVKDILNENYLSSILGDNGVDDVNQLNGIKNILFHLYMDIKYNEGKTVNQIAEEQLKNN